MAKAAKSTKRTRRIFSAEFKDYGKGQRCEKAPWTRSRCEYWAAQPRQRRCSEFLEVLISEKLMPLVILTHFC